MHGYTRQGMYKMSTCDIAIEKDVNVSRCRGDLRGPSRGKMLPLCIAAASSWAAAPSLRPCALQQRCATSRTLPPLACAGEDLKMALELAVAREDYAEAARLKKAIGAGAQQAETAAATGIDQRQAFLLEGDSIDKMIASAGEGVV
eukprot:5039234-Prymnesium_polylepis.1